MLLGPFVLFCDSSVPCRKKIQDCRLLARFADGLVMFLMEGDDGVEESDFPP